MKPIYLLAGAVALFWFMRKEFVATVFAEDGEVERSMKFASVKDAQAWLRMNRSPGGSWSIVEQGNSSNTAEGIFP